MKTSILTLGKALNRREQKSINGGGRPCSTTCYWSSWFPGDYCRTSACEFGQCDTNGFCEPV